MRIPEIMAIINVTPDSFSDGGLFDDASRAAEHAKRCVEEGANILDMGAESTRPGHAPVSAEDEKARLLPAVEAVRAVTDKPISIDTYKADVAEAGLKAGGTMLNDVWGLQRDERMAEVAAAHDVPTIVMHNRFDGADSTVDILDDMDRWFDRSLELTSKAGLKEERIVLDPGIGFGKAFEQNLVVLANLDRLKSKGFPILIGLSRKSFIGKILDNEVTERLFGTLSADIYCAMQDVDILRVHDVKPHAEALSVLRAIREKEPS